MIRHLYSKVALTAYLLIAISLGIWGYTIFKQRSGKIPAASNQQNKADKNSNAETTLPTAPPADKGSNTETSNNATSQTNSENTPATTDNSANDNTTPSSTTSNKTAPVSTETDVTGSVAAHITSQHCNSNCQAFANDLSLLEYCQEVCGISPVKNVTICDSKKGLQKDYCNKDLAINKKDASLCDKIQDANLKQACKNRISQDIIESL